MQQSFFLISMRLLLTFACLPGKLSPFIWSPHKEIWVPGTVFKFLSPWGNEGLGLPIPPTLAWKIPWTEEPGRVQSMGSPRVGHDWATSLSLFLSCIGEGNGNPFQCSCLENPRDGGAWWVALSGVAQSRTRLKWLSSSSSSWYQTTLLLSQGLYYFVFIIDYPTGNFFVFYKFC